MLLANELSYTEAELHADRFTPCPEKKNMHSTDGNMDLYLKEKSKQYQHSVTLFSFAFV